MAKKRTFLLLQQICLASGSAIHGDLPEQSMELCRRQGINFVFKKSLYLFYLSPNCVLECSDFIMQEQFWFTFFGWFLDTIITFFLRDVVSDKPMFFVSCSVNILLHVGYCYGALWNRKNRQLFSRDIYPISLFSFGIQNERGQIDCWSEYCIPPGTVHLRFPRLVPIVKALGIDFAPAMVGFEIRKRRSVPMYEGVVVCEEFKDVIMDVSSSSFLDHIWWKFSVVQNNVQVIFWTVAVRLKSSLTVRSCILVNPCLSISPTIPPSHNSLPWTYWLNF